MTCQCSDGGCPVHKGRNCKRVAETTVFRVDMEDVDGTPMCDGCASDALDSGVFTTKDESEDDDEDL